MKTELFDIVRRLCDPEHQDTTDLAISNMKNGSSFSGFCAILAAGAVNLHRAQLLEEAVKNASSRYLSALLDAGVSVDVKLGNGDSLLHRASRLSAFKALMQRGANPNAVNLEGARPLHSLCSRTNMFEHDIEKNRMIWAIEALVACGADVNAVDNKGRTPLHCALRFDSPRTYGFVNTLLTAGANANAIDAHGVTVLEKAMRLDVHGLELSRRLIESGANVRCTFSDGKSPLHLAAVVSCQHSDRLIPLLLRVGVDVNAIDCNGNTALHDVFQCDNCERVCLEDTAKSLIRAGAKIDIANAHGMTPFACLLSKARPSAAIIRFFLDNGAPVERNRQTGALHVTLRPLSAATSLSTS
jgi:ankyrin repeat protein